MASRYFSDFSDKKITAPTHRSSKSKGGPALWNGNEKVPDWKPAGKGWGSSFNRKTKMPVVKTRAKKQGID